MPECRNEPIAIVGIGCRFPGEAEDPDSFWSMLVDGRNAIVDVPFDRWNSSRFYSPVAADNGKLYIRRGGFLRQPIDRFDAEFFRISAREAARLDPQQRLLLEITWEAVEDAGQSLDRLRGSNTGVFIGGFMMDHAMSQLGASGRKYINSYTASGSSLTMLSARIAFFLDLRGPALSIDTACSSSLVATHLACKSIWDGECRMAIAGGVNVMLSPDMTIALCKANMLARDGRSKAFDAEADGYGRGEGAGVVFLKPLREAQAEGDWVYASILGTAVNQDGYTPTGISVPSQESQEAVIRQAYARAQVDPHDVYYVEAHGTGTAVGDPIEAVALGAALGAGRTAGNALVISSAKPNIGHLEGAAGIAGLIKTALCLRHGQIPPHVFVGEPNPRIPFDRLGLRIPRTLEDWPLAPEHRIAGVSAFGFGGTNAHVVLRGVAETKGATKQSSDRAGDVLLVLSAAREESLKQVAADYIAYLRSPQSSSVSLANMAYTLARRRSHLDHRLTVIAGNAAEAAEQLEQFVLGASGPRIITGRARRPVPKLAWVFTGMGPQYAGMGRELYRHEPVFRQMVDDCDSLFSRFSASFLRSEFGGDSAYSRINETEVAQVVNFTLQVALVRLYQSWGVRPDAIIGHSVGEVAAGFAAGALDLETAARVCYYRSRILGQLSGAGGLLAAKVSSTDAAHLMGSISNDLCIAALNSPLSVTFSGGFAALSRLADLLTSRGVDSRMLRVNVPYHSHYLDALRSEFLTCLNEVTAATPVIPLYSTVSGALVQTNEFNAEYWWKNARDCVDFAGAVTEASCGGCELFQEIGPSPVLSSAILECLEGRAGRTTVLGSLQSKEPEQLSLLGSLGRLHVCGFPLKWEQLYPKGTLVFLPKYPWYKETYWAEAEESLQDRVGLQDHPLLGRSTLSPQPAWANEIDPTSLTELADHRIHGEIVFPGAAYIELAIAAGRDLTGEVQTRLQNIRFHRALVLRSSIHTHVAIEPATGALTIHGAVSRESRSWTLYASGQRVRSEMPVESAPISLDRLRDGMEEVPASTVYHHLDQLGYNYGPSFQGISKLWMRHGEVLAMITRPAQLDGERYCMHPALLDACLHSMIYPASRDRAERGLYLPTAVEQVDFKRTPGNVVWAHARLTANATDRLEADMTVWNDLGDEVLSMQRIQASYFAERHLWNADVEGYFQVWKAAAKRASLSNTLMSWLILADSGRVGECVADQLRSKGHTVVVVKNAEHYRRIDDKSFVLSAQNKEDFGALLKDLRETSFTPSVVVYLWSLSEIGSEGGHEEIESATSDCGALVHLIQSLSALRQAPRLWLVTRGSQSVSRKDSVCPSRSLLWGIARNLVLEQPELRTTIVDLPFKPTSDDSSNLVIQLLDERADTEIAVRDGQRYVNRFQIVDPDTDASPGPRKDTLFRADATYLIAGGLGGFGFETAKWLVRRGGRNIALIGRSGPEVHGKEGEIQALQDLGAEVCFLKANIADSAELQFALDTIRCTMPPLRGVINAASDFKQLPGQEALLALATHDLIKKHTSAKIRGTWLLHSKTLEDKLDFFLVFSSVAALMGAVGAAHYVVANVFLDAFVHYRRGLGLPALSINWGAVADAGVLARHQELAQHIDELGNIALPAATLLEEIEHSIFSHQVQIGVGRIDWKSFSRTHSVLARSPRFTEIRSFFRGAAAEEATQLDRIGVLRKLDPHLRRVEVRKGIRRLVAELLETSTSKVGTEAPLRNWGIDSLGCVSLQLAIQDEFGAMLPLVLILEGPPIEQLTTLVLERIS